MAVQRDGDAVVGLLRGSVCGERKKACGAAAGDGGGCVRGGVAGGGLWRLWDLDDLAVCGPHAVSVPFGWDGSAVFGHGWAAVRDFGVDDAGADVRIAGYGPDLPLFREKTLFRSLDAVGKLFILPCAFGSASCDARCVGRSVILCYKESALSPRAGEHMTARRYRSQ